MGNPNKPNECKACGNKFLMSVKIDNQGGTQMFQCQSDNCNECHTVPLE